MHGYYVTHVEIIDSFRSLIEDEVGNHFSSIICDDIIPQKESIHVFIQGNGI